MHYKRRSRRRDHRHMAACGCCEIITANKFPIEDGPCTGNPKPKKPKPAKDRCSVNRTHEWYVEDFEKTTYGYFGTTRTYHYRRSTCIHCWKVKDKPVRQPYRWRSGPLRIPKRTVKLY